MKTFFFALQNFVAPSELLAQTLFRLDSTSPTYDAYIQILTYSRHTFTIYLLLRAVYEGVR